jgi:hypothetical protein
MGMRVRFVKNVDCDFYDRSMDETYPKYMRRWDEVLVERVVEIGDMAELTLDNGDVYSNVPKHSFDKISVSTLA